MESTENKKGSPTCGAFKDAYVARTFRSPQGALFVTAFQCLFRYAAPALLVPAWQGAQVAVIDLRPERGTPTGRGPALSPLTVALICGGITAATLSAVMARLD